MSSQRDGGTPTASHHEEHEIACSAMSEHDEGDLNSVSLGEVQSLHVLHGETARMVVDSALRG
jgi:hypothetical protein